MADYVSAHISMGGHVRPRVVPKLCEAICREGVSLEWGEPPFRPASTEELGRACQEIGGKWTLRLCCDEVADGEFTTLQAFLVRHKFPFNRWHESKYEIPCELLVYRPGGKPLRYLTDQEGGVTLRAAQLVELVEELAEVQRLVRAGSRSAPSQLRRCRRRLAAHLPPSIPPLPPITIGGR